MKQMIHQKIFNPASYTFEWTEDWYKWDRTEAHKAALKARNAEAKRLKTLGFEVQKCSLQNQLMSMGGAGSNKPHISLVVNCYMVNAYQN